MNRYSKIAIGLVAMATAAVASAQKAGDDIVSAGVAVINQDISVGTLTSTSNTFTSYLVGASAKTSGATTATFGWLHLFTNNIGAEMTLGLPPRIKMDITTPVLSSSHSDAAAADVYTPAIVAKYIFRNPDDTFRPYAGIGVSFVSFKNVTVNKSDSTINALAGTSAKLDDSWAPVYNVGLIYNIDQRWSISGSVSYVPIETKMTFVGSGATTSGTVKFNTTDYVLRVGYKF